MFKTGEEVTWKSQAKGVMKVKVGKVLAILEPGQLPETLGFKNNKTLRGAKSPREVVSYIIQVGNTVYWPKVKGLVAQAVEKCLTTDKV